MPLNNTASSQSHGWVAAAVRSGMENGRWTPGTRRVRFSRIQSPRQASRLKLGSRVKVVMRKASEDRNVIGANHADTSGQKEISAHRRERMAFPTRPKTRSEPNTSVNRATKTWRGETGVVNSI